MLVVEFRDNTRAVLQDEVAWKVVGTDVDGDVLIETRAYQPATRGRDGVIENRQYRPGTAPRAAIPGELRPLTPCCHHVGEQCLDYKSRARCSHCADPVGEKYIMAAQVYTGVERVCSVEEAMRNTLGGKVDNAVIAQASQYVTEHCVA